MGNTPPAPELSDDAQASLGQVGYESAAAYLRLPGRDIRPWSELREADQAAWSAAATAIVIAYDRSLFQAAEDKAVNMGLDPMPLPGIVPPANA